MIVYDTVFDRCGLMAKWGNRGERTRLQWPRAAHRTVLETSFERGSNAFCLNGSPNSNRSVIRRWMERLRLSSFCPFFLCGSYLPGLRPTLFIGEVGRPL